MIRVPEIPLTNMGLRDFLSELTAAVQNNDRPCKGYSVAGDTSGRVLITATFDSIDQEPFSLTLELVPVTKEQD